MFPFSLNSFQINKSENYLISQKTSQGWGEGGSPSTQSFPRGYSAPATVTGTGEMEPSETGSHPEGAQGPDKEAGQLQTRAQKVA